MRPLAPERVEREGKLELEEAAHFFSTNPNTILMANVPQCCLYPPSRLSCSTVIVTKTPDSLYLGETDLPVHRGGFQKDSISGAPALWPNTQLSLHPHLSHVDA